MPDLTTKEALLEKLVERTTILKQNIGVLMPVGCVQAFAGSTTPDGWLLCDGSAVSRTDYADLYNVIGTTYGSGDGSTTFNLPNLVDKFVEGSATAGTEKTAGLPNLTGSVGLRAITNTSFVLLSNESGAIGRETVDYSSYNGVASGSSLTKASNLLIDASKSSAIYGNSTTVQPPAITMRYIIKY